MGLQSDRGYSMQMKKLALATAIIIGLTSCGSTSSQESASGPNPATEYCVSKGGTIEVAKEEVKKDKPKVRKLSKKLLLIAATEAIDDSPTIIEPEKSVKKTKKVKEEKKTKPAKKLLIVESDSDED